MIECLVRTRPGATRTSPKEKGGFICCKRAPAIWGTEEVKVHQLIEVPETEFTPDQLAVMNDNQPLIYPFGEYNTETEQYTRASRVLLKIGELPARDREAIEDPNREHPKFRPAPDKLNRRTPSIITA